jgi:methionyl-tRNA formyltransferase
MNSNLRLGFAGTPEFAATALDRLISSDFKPVVVFTQPDRPTGRGRKLKPSPVKVLAQSHGIEVQEPVSLKGVSLEAYELDLLVVAAYGLLLPSTALDAPRLGCLNIHASLLPRWRGAAPVERAIMAGDTETGVCLMQMDEGLDTGDVYVRAAIPIAAEDTGGSLERKLAVLGARLLVEFLPCVETRSATVQSESGITYANKVTARDRSLDWSESATSIARQVRALADRDAVTVFGTGPEPVRIRLLAAHAQTDSSSGDRAPPGTILAVDRLGVMVACGSGRLLVERLQLNRGKGRPLSALDAANGHPDIIAPGKTLAARQEHSPGVS